MVETIPGIWAARKEAFCISREHKALGWKWLRVEAARTIMVKVGRGRRRARPGMLGRSLQEIGTGYRKTWGSLVHNL